MSTPLDSTASAQAAQEAQPHDHATNLEKETQEHAAAWQKPYETPAQKRNLLRTLIDIMPDFIYVKDTESRFLVANTAVAQVMGAKTPYALLGKTDHDFYPPELADRYRTDEQEVITQGRSLINREEPVIDRDGNLRWISTTKVPLRDEQGKVIGLVGIGRDITERKKAEEALWQAHRQNEELITSISSILIGLSSDDHISFWNAAAETALGIPTVDVIGRPLKGCNIRWDCAKVNAGLSECRHQGKTVRLRDVRYTRGDGSEGFLDLSINPFIQETDGRSGLLLLGEDVTERKILESQLSQAQRLESIGQLAAGIAHEINTPTQYVGDNTRFLQESFQQLVKVLEKHRLLLEACKAGSVSAELVSEAERAWAEADVEFLLQEIPVAIHQSLEGVERVSKIVRAMKEFSHPGPREKTMVDINRAIESTVTVARNEWKYVAEMELDLDPNLPLVPCLPGEFNQVILNIIINAAHAIADVVGDGSRGKGKIRISTRHDRNWTEIRISDTGTGIPEKIRGRIFEPFFTTKEVGKGTGQGLAMAHNVIVDKHGGTITFETEEGKGTTFIVRLPLEAKSGK